MVDFGSGCLDFGVEEKEKQPDVVRWAARFLYLYTFYFIRWSITTMPLAGRFLLFCFLLVEVILAGRGA